jgi:hypothetical protein
MHTPLVFGTYGPIEHPDYYLPDPCDTCEHDPCTCDQETDDARDGGL